MSNSSWSTVAFVSITSLFKAWCRTIDPGNFWASCGFGMEHSSISPTIALQLSTHASAQRFVVNGCQIKSTVISDFMRLACDAQLPISAYATRGDPLRLLFNGLWNSSLEQDCLFGDRAYNAPFRSGLIALLYVGPLEGILCDYTFSITNPDSLFETLLRVGSDYSPLLCHIHGN
jgi:hypothetical protein